MIYLHKVLPLLLSPLLIIVIIIILGVMTSSKKTSLFGVVLLLIGSFPIFSDRLVFFLERNYQPQDSQRVLEADAIVVLSGMVRLVQINDYDSKYEWSEASDRIFAGIELFKRKKAPTLILTRGQVPWSIGYPEGEYLQTMAVSLGVPKKNILLTENVENTEQEARAVSHLISKRNPRIILVTSAFHMPRAEKVFKAVGIDVIAFPVDFQSGLSKTTIMHFIPSAEGLSNTSFFAREMIGRLYYYLKY